MHLIYLYDVYMKHVVILNNISNFLIIKVFMRIYGMLYLQYKYQIYKPPFFFISIKEEMKVYFFLSKYFCLFLASRTNLFSNLNRVW